MIYKKGLEGDVLIRSPNDLGGLKSAEYRTLNPQGLMPLLLLPDGTSFYESEVAFPPSPLPFWHRDDFQRPLLSEVNVQNSKDVQAFSRNVVGQYT